MITVKQLLDYLYAFEHAALNLPAGTAAETVETIQVESLYSFQFFWLFITKDENAVLPPKDVQAIRSYLSLRWETLKKENIAYFRFPFLPINQFCLKIAESIAEPEEAVCSILMPGIIGLNREGLSLKLETEDNGQFQIDAFIVNQSYTRLIPLAEIFQTAALDSNHVLADFQPEGAKPSYELGGQDFLNLANVAGNASRAFMQALKANHVKRYDDNSLGFAIKKLAVELKKASVSDAGSEELINNKVMGDAVSSFYNLWKTLSPELRLPEEKDAESSEKRFVKVITLTNYGCKNLNLESYFLTLFFHMQLPLTEEEVTRVIAENIFPCADQISNILLEFLNQYPTLYHISINANRNEECAALAPMASLLPDVIKALEHRSPIWESRDNLDSQFMELLIKSPQCHRQLDPSLFIALRIKSYNCCRRLIQSRICLKSVASLSNTRLASFAYESNLHTLILSFSEAQQQVIVETHYKDLIREYNDADKLLTLTSQLSQASLDFLRRKYAETLAPDICSVEDLCNLTKKVDGMIIDLVFEKLQDKYPELLSTSENALKALKFFSRKGNQQEKIICYINPKLSEWITPENFCTFNFWLVHSIQFSSLIADQIKSRINSFDTWKMEYIRWGKIDEIQTILREQLIDQFSTELNDGATLQSVVEATSPVARITLISQYKKLINSKELFTQFAKILPEQCKQAYLRMIEWERFAGSIDELKEIAAFFQWDQIQSLISTRFSAEQLKCTEEEFSALLPGHSPEEDELIKNFDQDYIIYELESYISKRQSARGLRLWGIDKDIKVITAKKLINELKSSALISEQINVLRDARNQLRLFYSSGGDELEEVIAGILKGKKPSNSSSFHEMRFARNRLLLEEEERRHSSTRSSLR
ncbi:hypothetical protein Lbir_0731 [Legionella birminghamensis]|uniref:Uncharacterized protein n=1 Tax=Legionella birminghamensis TaxID=28083 RepID=A0A378IAA4_9GAMM|nr:hypothetical protein [Legionella birminghamensis]KTC74698.1 hypothetical protein Lbir_0731 [Legionella birminghamensis]STX31501.1 Uncharacterised protein [Legionella birminghamensis]